MRARNHLRLLFESRVIPARAPFFAAFVEDAFGSDDVVYLAFALVEDGDFLGIFERHLGIDFLRHMPRERQGRAQRRCRGRVCAPVVPSGLRLTWLMDG